MDRRFEDGFGNVFTEEEAMEDVRQNISIEDYFTFGDFDVTEVLRWCFNQDNFIEAFRKNIEQAEQDYFNEFYLEIDDEEEEEE